MAQHPWLENDCLFADLILPVNTKFEEEDIGDDVESMTFEMVYLEHQCIEPLGESKSDYEIVCMVAERLGLLEEYTGRQDHTRVDQRRLRQERHPCRPACSTWEKFQEKQYYVVPVDPNWENHPAGMYEFYNDPEKNPLETPSGKLEFESVALKKFFPDDKERPPVPHWVEKSELHDERIAGKRAAELPAPLHEQPSAAQGACPAGRHQLEPRDSHLQGQGSGRLSVRAAVDPSFGGSQAGHQRRGHLQGVQRERHRAGRGPGLGAGHAGRGLRGSRGQGRFRRPR